MFQSLLFYARVFFIGAWFFIGCFVSICMLAVRWKDPSMGAVLGRIVHWGGSKLLGAGVRVEGQSKLYTSQPCVYVPNHQSNLDIITMGSMFPWRTVVIGKKELKWTPLFGLFFVGSGMIMIDRQNRANSVAGLEQAKEAMLREGKSIWIFPEGTRNRGQVGMLPFKKGAFHIAIAAQVPIVPIVQQHLRSYFDVAARRIYNKDDILIQILEPVPTVGMTVADLPKLMETVRGKMMAAMAAPELKYPPELLDGTSSSQKQKSPANSLS